MIGDLASVCVLSYERPEFLKEAIRSARDYAEYPCEIIVHDDGSEAEDCYTLINVLMGNGFISRSIFQVAGNNQGVGESIRVAFGAAQGDVLVKFDQDCIARQGWLRKAVDILFNVVEIDGELKRIGMLGLFEYQAKDDRFQTIRQHNGFREVTDFVGSAFVIARDVYDEVGPIPTHSDAFAEDVELKLRLQAAGYLLALPNEDLITNQGFGVGPSTVCVSEGPDGVRPIHHSSVIFNKT
jgi:GT2 family glycosyltransferase